LDVEAVKIGLPPLVSPDAGLLILGSLPGDASLSARQYYAHPTNQFWRLLGGVLGEDLPAIDYDKRLKRLAERRVGLWDVIASAERRGSLDHAIRLAEHNRIERFLDSLPALRAIAFNGATAAKVGRKLIGKPLAGLSLLDLPSSSAANTARFDDKARAWAQLGAFVQE
jgi:hypoxanthine-DNA glycosylase